MIKAAVFGAIKDEKPNINERYFEHIKRCGVIPVTAYPKSPYETSKECDCLIVCGGGDMNPKFYGQKPFDENQTYDSVFDEYEIAMIKEFISQKKAILGICRGMQTINVVLGGSLIQDIPSMLGLCHKGDGSSVCMHEIKISKSSKLSNTLGIRAVVNSYHHQSVHKLGEELFVAAASHDGIIEAIEGMNSPILGIQWHPERMSGNDVFDHFFTNICKK